VVYESPSHIPGFGSGFDDGRAGYRRSYIEAGNGLLLHTLMNMSVSGMSFVVGQRQWKRWYISWMHDSLAALSSPALPRRFLYETFLNGSFMTVFEHLLDDVLYISQIGTGYLLGNIMPTTET